MQTTKLKATKAPRNIVGGIPLESALKITLMLVQSHNAGKHQNQNVAECMLCRHRKG